MSTKGHESESINVQGLKSSLQKLKTNHIDGKAAKSTTLAGYGITDAYTKSETYTKTEVNGLVDTPHQEYVTVDAYANLPETGSKDTIYRVSNYNGSTSQVDASVYSEYAWNGSQYIFLCVKSQIGEVFDISVYNNNAKYADLAAALGTNGANIPEDLRKGGMSIKFVQSSDNKYVQARLMANEFTTDISAWQGVDAEPTAGSRNLVESGGVDMFVGKRILKIVGILNNSIEYGQNWKVGDIFFNTNTNLLRRCTSVNQSGEAQSLETVDFDATTIYLCNNVLYRWNGSKLALLTKIVTLTSITNDAAVTNVGQFWYSSTNKVIRICSGIITKTSYNLASAEDCIYIWNGEYYIYDAANGLRKIATIDSAKESAKEYTDEQLNKTRIPVVFVGRGGSLYAPNWKVGDIMFNTDTHLLRKCESVNEQGDSVSFSTIEPLEDTILIYKGVNLVIDANETNYIKCISHIIPVKSITNSDPVNVGDLYLSSNYKNLRIKQSNILAIELPTLEDAIFLYNDTLLRVLDGNIVPISESANILTSSYSSTPATTTIPLNTITPSENIHVSQLIIANPSNSYLYRITAIGNDSVTVEYYSTLRGKDGNRGEQGLQGNSGYAGAAGELEVVNNLEDGGATAALSAEQGKILGNWKTFNAEPLILQKKNPKSLQIIDLNNWQSDSKGSIGANVVKMYDEILQQYVETRPFTSNSQTSNINGAVFTRQLSASIDMTTNVLRGAIYMDLNYTPSDIRSLNISLFSGNTIDSDHRAWTGLYATTENPYYDRSGWFHFCLNIPAQSHDGYGSLFDATNITHIGFNVNHAAGTTLNLAITEFDIVPCLQKPGIVTIVDNFNPNVPEMASYAASKGVRLNLSIIPNWIENNDSRTGTLQQVYNAAKQGHFIFNHTWNHQIYGGQPTLEVFEQIDKADRWMIEKGLSRGSKILSNPSAAFDNDKYKAYFASQAVMVYHHWTKFFNPKVNNNRTKCILYYPYKGMERLLNISLLDSYFVEDFSELTPSAVLGANAAIDYGGILVCGFHGVKYGNEGYITDMSIWEDYIDAISALDVHHYTIDELLEGAFI